MEEAVVYTRGTPEVRAEIDKRRRKAGVPKKSYEPVQLWDRYQEVARRVFLGQKNKQIAEDLSIAPETVSYIRNSEIVQSQLKNLQARANNDVVSIANRIKDMAPKALDVLEQMIDGTVDGETIPAKMRAFHAEKLLDRAGHAPPKEVRSLNVSAHYTSEDIERIKQRAIEGGMRAGCVRAEVIEVQEEELEVVKPSYG